MVRHYLWRVLALAALVLTLFQLGTTSVAAASISASPGRIAPNGTVFVFGTGFAPNDTITLVGVGPSGTVSTLTYVANGAGEFAAYISSQGGAFNPGVYTLTATGTRT